MGDFPLLLLFLFLHYKSNSRRMKSKNFHKHYFLTNKYVLSYASLLHFQHPEIVRAVFKAGLPTY